MSNATHRPPVGVLVPPSTAPSQLTTTSTAVERWGFSELWFGEDYFFLAGPSSAAIALAATTEISVGVGIISAVVRHPAVLAMEISTLAGAYPGRFITGIGHGVPVWTKQMGLYPKSPLTSLRAVIETTRRLVAGENLDIDDGPYHFDNIKLVHPVDGPVPIFAGVVGAKSLEMSGQVADGTILSVLSAPEYLKFVRSRVEAGAARGDRDPGTHKLPTFVIYSVSEEREEARNNVRPVVAHFLSAVGPTAMTGVYGLNDQLVEILELGDLGAIADAIPEDWLDVFAIAGTPDECVGKINELLAAGATTVVLAPYPAEASLDVLEMTASQVLPGVDTTTRKA